MIVKNESAIITRLLESVRSLIDCYCICDTGSTDNTEEVITQFFEAHGIPGKMVHEPFVNFAHNRNVALQACAGMSDFVLLLDADMVLERGSGFFKEMLLAGDSFQMLQGCDSFRYLNTRIVRNNGLYLYTGVTHEFINTPPHNRNVVLNREQLFVRDIGDGGCKTDKFERDIRLLSEALETDPNNGRYVFYLANSYHDTGRWDQAIAQYERRIALGGWVQELWFSWYRIGLCYKNSNRMPNAICAWFDGYECCPERLEGLYEILHHCRMKSKHKLGQVIYDMAKKQLDRNLSRTDYLFVHEDVYTSKIYYEYTILAAYNGRTNINDEIVLVMNNSRHSGEVQNLFQNMKFYKDVFQADQTIYLDNTYLDPELGVEFFSSSSCLIPVPKKQGNKPPQDEWTEIPLRPHLKYDSELDTSSSSDYSRASPVHPEMLIEELDSRHKPEAAYWLNIRYVNYVIDAQGGYHRCDQFICSKNKWMALDAELRPVDEKWMATPEDVNSRRYNGYEYKGVEDIKIFEDTPDGHIQFIGTLANEKKNKIGICTGEYNVESGALENVLELEPSFAQTSCEKNWTFVTFNGTAHIVYSWHPLRLCKAERETGLLHVVETRNTPRLFSHLRGSTSGFRYEDEIWFVQHLVAHDSPRGYYHTVSVFDSQMNLKRYSAPFKFTGDQSIEYCLGIVVEPTRVLISYSTHDRTTRIGVYNKEYIEGKLKYVC